jgi:glycosyltransferase involved in cell wall biosynthesis
VSRPSENGKAAGDGRGGAALRVGYVVKKYPRLSETFILDEILALEAFGIDVSIFSLRFPDDGRFHSDLASVRAPVSYLPPLGSGTVFDAFRALEQVADGDASARLSRALGFLDLHPPERRTGMLLQGLHLAGASRRLGLDHLHAHFMTVAAHTAYLAHLFGDVPFSVTAHAKDIYRDAVDRTAFREVAGAATALVTVCEANRAYMRESLLADGTGVEVIYDGVRLEELRPSRRPRRRTLLLAVGRLVEKKGYHVLLRACRILADRGTDFECIVVGEGEERERLLADRARLGLDTRVHFVGAVSRDRIYAWMEEARVLAAPSLVGADGNRDALPTVLLEALALGLPAVATPVGGIPEIIESGVEGLLVPSGDPEAVAAALERLLQDDVTWERMAMAGPAKAALRFDGRRNLPRLVDVFRRPARGDSPAVANGGSAPANAPGAPRAGP